MHTADGGGALLFWRNDERARAFGRPTLRSLAPNALLVGYSITAVDSVDVVVESNHVLRRVSVAPTPPRSFTSRTWSVWADAGLEWRLHAMDHVMNTFSSWEGQAPQEVERDELDRALSSAPLSSATLLIDDEWHTGEAFEYGSARFVRVFLRDSMISVAAPATVYAHGFSSQPRGVEHAIE